MLKRMVKVIPALLLAILPCLSTGTITPAAAAELYQYTAFPPFLPRVVSPNILFILDYSKSMVRPAYGVCDSSLKVGAVDCRTIFVNPADDYDAATTYSGYFDTSYDYTYTTTGTSRFTKLTSPDTTQWDGNWLNWLTMTQFDVLKKVVVGGDVTPVPENAAPTKIQSVLSVGNQFYKIVTKAACTANAPDTYCDTSAPQAITYSWKDPIGAPLAEWTGDRDAGTGQLVTATLPFDFKFFDTTYSAGSSITISVDGIIRFGSHSDTPTDGDMPSVLSEDTIAPYWDDSSMSAAKFSKVKTFVLGTAPARTYVVTFENMMNDDDGGKANPFTYQVLFFEAGSQLVFQYKEVWPAQAFGAGKLATIGVQKSNDVTRFKVRKNRLVLTNTVTNLSAFLMTPEAKLFNITPGNPSQFNPYGSADLFNVAIDVNGTAKVDGDCPSGYYPSKSRSNCLDHVTDGLLQEFRDGELAGLLGFRLAIMELNGEDGGHVIKHFNENEIDPVTLATGKKGPALGWPSLMSATRGKAPQDQAPISEALHMAQGYFREVTANYDLGLNSASAWTNHGTGSCVSTGNNYDPFCFQSAAQKVPCAKSYALLVSAGNYSHDFGQNIFGDAAITDKVPYSSAVALTLGETAGSNEWTSANGGWLDNVAYKMHTTDLRADIEGAQTVALYAVNTFGAGSGAGTAVMKRAALYGGFKDADSDGAYDPGEDVNGNCILDTGEDTNSNGIIDGAEDDCTTKPRTYFSASGGGDLRAKIVDAVTDILKNSASGTSVSVLSTSAGGEGALYQAYFYPARIENQQEDRKWPGFLRAFLLDTYQQLRDDYSGNGTPDHTLNTSNDRVAKMFLDPNSSEVKVNLYATAGKLADPAPSPTATVTMDNVASMWEGGTQLAKSTKSERHIYLWHDANNDEVIDNKDFSSLGGEAIALVEGNAATLAPYLNAQGVDAAAKTAEAVKIINFTRGAEIAGYRSRCITVPGATQETGCLGSNQRVWPLGDIIFSTPTLVGAPAEKYNQIYGDQSYFAFYNKYKNRRQVVYLGANDGMLHAFNAGSFNPATISFADNPASGNGWTSPLPGLGDELWSFIPYENLPHLAWLACNGTATDPATCGDSEYTHVYYVDHRPRVTDAQIFTPDATHPNGWGSVLILPLRLGGGAIDVTDDFGTGAETRQFRSSYYAFDVTDAEQPPKLLWRFTDPNLGFTTSYPAIVRVDDNGATAGGTVKWFMVVGSGPQNTIAVRDYGMTAHTTQAGKVFVVDLATGILAHQNTFVAANTIMGDPIAVDVNIDFTTDVVYIGSAINTTAGRVFRINTANRLFNGKYVGETNPALWSYTTFFDPDSPAGDSPDPDTGKDMGPLLVSPSVSMDRYGHLWVYFGSGRLKNTNDLTNSHQQRFYGIKDACWEDIDSSNCIADRTTPGPNNTTITTTNTPYKLATLFNSSAVKVTTSSDSLTQVEAPAATACYDGTATTSSNTTCSYQGMVANIQTFNKGWYVTLDNPTGASERVLARSSVIGGLVLFTTYQPSGDICSIFGNSSLYAVHYETGTASTSAVVEGTAGVFTENSKTYVRPKIDLGAGMPTSVGIAIGETVSGFVQKSTGEIIRIEATPALKVRSSISGWRETTGNTGNAGVETIYEHIVK